MHVTDAHILIQVSEFSVFVLRQNDLVFQNELFYGHIVYFSLSITISSLSCVIAMKAKNMCFIAVIQI